MPFPTQFCFETPFSPLTLGKIFKKGSVFGVIHSVEITLWKLKSLSNSGTSGPTPPFSVAETELSVFLVAAEMPLRHSVYRSAGSSGVFSG